ncbi:MULTISPECIES: hypothetical protein [Polyangium]|uniref:Lipoprotein n=2 Tax=Polyangium TaxID=55 RepID=A0A4U1IZ42_9BACT|nr:MULTISPECIES: hypothetical protein [Polyangium]MDI1435159.1 hypothetical protein [Polyangium sorediatum]TKC99878.1 hypothetical protein E8A74_36300 [Polyangium fumosum]
MSPRASLFLLAAAALAAGCEPSITALTIAPPTAVADVDNVEKDVRLSQGIALAIECTYQNSPCEDATATSSDPEIVRVLPGFVDLLAPGDAYQRYATDVPRAVFIFVGGKPGDAVVTLTSSDGNTSIDVNVLPLP